MESSAQLLQKAIQHLELFSEVSLSTKIVIGFVLALILVLFALVSERCFEARIYNRRKILFGHSQRIARARGCPHSLAPTCLSIRFPEILIRVLKLQV